MERRKEKGKKKSLSEMEKGIRKKILHKRKLGQALKILKWMKAFIVRSLDSRPLIPVNFSFNEMDVVRKREVEIREDSSLLVTRNLTPQQVVEFQPRIYYSLTRSDRDSKEKSFDECVH